MFLEFITLRAKKVHWLLQFVHVQLTFNLGFLFCFDQPYNFVRFWCNICKHLIKISPHSGDCKLPVKTPSNAVLFKAIIYANFSWFFANFTIIWLLTQITFSQTSAFKITENIHLWQYYYKDINNRYTETKWLQLELWLKKQGYLYMVKTTRYAVIY